jgi:hypothetical protein
LKVSTVSDRRRNLEATEVELIEPDADMKQIDRLYADVQAA